jgi:tetratricopeptide (TPR) repeat protein
MADGLRRMTDNQSRSWMTLYLTWLAEARQLAGDRDGALAAVEDALAVNPQEVFARPQALTLRGDLRAARLEDAEADYAAALSLAATIGSPLQQRAAADALRRLRATRGLTV